jgi:hypothetical protein
MVFILPACKRNAVNQPDPLGPSTYAIVLRMAANPNVLFAGADRERTTITASLIKFDGIPLANTTIQFHIRDSLGARANLGYFDNGESVAVRTTNQNGNITLEYYGPTSAELITDSQIYIYGMVAWEGKEFITEITPVFLIRDVTEIAFEIYADPNVLWCTGSNPRSTIKAYLKKADGSPLANRRVIFSVLSGPGNFSDGKTKTTAMTNASGYAFVTYVGPKGSQINRDQFVEIRGQPETATPFYIHEEVNVRLVKGS